MAAWRYEIGNVVSRATRAPVAVSPASEDPLLPLANLGDGYSDLEGALAWRSDGTYDIDVDGNLLAETSESVAAPTGWYDLLNLLAGTPGLPENPPEWGTFAGRTALKFFRPVVQEVEVMPGEGAKITGSIYRPSAASPTTAVRVQVVDLTTGHQYDADAPGWDDDGLIEEQAATNAWLDFSVEIPADTTHTERRVYRVIISPVAAAYSAESYGYISASGGSGSPGFFVEVDTVALLGQGLPVGTVVQLQPQPSGAAIALPLVQPSCYAVGVAPLLVQTWRLSIDVPTALRPSAPRPKFGALWLGKARSFDRTPTMPIELKEGDPGQIRVKAGRGRIEVLTDDGRPTASMALQVKAPEADYVRVRDEIMRLTRFGKEPMLLMPGEEFEGAGRFYHGRVGEEIAYSRFTAADSEEPWRSFVIAFGESPLAAP